MAIGNDIFVKSEASYKLLSEVVRYYKSNEPKQSDKWISGVEEMKMLRVKSKSTLQKMRDDGLGLHSPIKRLNCITQTQFSFYLEDRVYEPFEHIGAKNKKV